MGERSADRKAFAGKLSDQVGDNGCEHSRTAMDTSGPLVQLRRHTAPAHRAMIVP